MTRYKTVMADPPWKYKQSLQMADGVKRSAEDVYRTVMDTDAICKLVNGMWTGKIGASEIATTIMGQPLENDALLALWVTNPFLLNGDGPKVCRAWGFEPKQLFTWVKGDLRDDAIVGPLGMGHIFRVDTEHLIIATRGKLNALPVLRHDLRNYIFVSPKGEHSAKPEEIPILLETLAPGPYLELFARRPRAGWDVVGDELPLTDGV